MTLGKRARGQQGELWVAANRVQQAPGHPFYEALNRLLAEAGFDSFVEGLCAPFYSSTGKPGLAPGIYFRALLIGYFEGIGSERGIDWRCADSLSLRRFLGIALTESTPDHSTLSKTRKRLSLEAHEEAFAFVLRLLAEQGLLGGEGIAIDASQLHANASLESLVRRDSGESYHEFLTQLATESGIETPTRADLKRLDRERKKQGTKRTKNDDWHNPHDPDAKVMKTPKSGTKMTYKAENAVDSGSGAILSACVHLGDVGDTTSGLITLEAANNGLGRLSDERPEATLPGEFVVCDSGYHSDSVLLELDDAGFVPMIAERDASRHRNWADSREPRKDKAQRATYANRSRLQSQRGTRLRKARAEFTERAFAHLLDSGGLRRVYVRGRENVAKRYVLHAAAFNLGLLLRHLIGVGKPRCLQGARATLQAALQTAHAAACTLLTTLWLLLTGSPTRSTRPVHPSTPNRAPSRDPRFPSLPSPICVAATDIPVWSTDS